MTRSARRAMAGLGNLSEDCRDSGLRSMIMVIAVGASTGLAAQNAQPALRFDDSRAVAKAVRAIHGGLFSGIALDSLRASAANIIIRKGIKESLAVGRSAQRSTMLTLIAQRRDSALKKLLRSRRDSVRFERNAPPFRPPS